jgi:trans-2,3-dihydro-3-hydroxyanthranilate isomerase
VTGLTVAFEVVDVFTDRPYAGNPLAVVLDADDLGTEQLQAIAREFNLSETAFPLQAPDGATYGLRIFTPATELPFAGHPSVGAAWVLHRLGRLDAGPNVQACGAGLLPVHVTARGATLTGGAPSLSDPLDPAPLLAAVGLDERDLAGPAPRWSGVGIDFCYLLVRREALSRVRVDAGRVAALGRSGIAVVSWDGTGARSRVFPGGVGVVEDPATGSAALGLGVFLAATLGDGEHAYVVEQGHELGRPAALSCTVDVAAGAAVRTTVTGQVVPVSRGEIRIP